MRDLSGTDGAELPFWSPDGRLIAFFAQRQLKKIDAPTGRIVTICATEGAGGGTWNNKGEIVFAVAPPGPLYRVSASGGQPVAITKNDAGWPQFMPDGSLLYSILTAGSDEASVYAMAEDGASTGPLFKAPGRVVFTSAGGGSLVYSKQGKLLEIPFDPVSLRTHGQPRLLAPFVGYSDTYKVRLFSAGPDGIAFQAGDPDRAHRLVWLDRTGRSIGTLGEPGRYSLPRLSPDGRQVLVARSDARDQSDIWIIDSRTGVSRQVTAEKNRGSHPVWSPDGKEFLYAATGPEYHEIVRANVTGPLNRRVLYRTGQYSLATDWLPNQIVLIDRSHATPMLNKAPPPQVDAIWTISAHGSELAELVARFAKFTIFGGKLSPDGHWLAFTSDSETPGTLNVYVADFKGRTLANGLAHPLRISTDGGFEPEWSSDGGELYYINGARQLVSAAVPASGGFQAGPGHVLFSVPETEKDSMRYEPGLGYSPSHGGLQFLFNMQTSEPSPELTVLRR